MRNKSPKRRVKAQLREDRLIGDGGEPDLGEWISVHDQLFDGRKIRVLTIVDTFTRLSPAIDVRQNYRGADVVATLERIASSSGRPKRIRVDNGPEFISKELDLWAWMHGVDPWSRRATRSSCPASAARQKARRHIGCRGRESHPPTAPHSASHSALLDQVVHRSNGLIGFIDDRRADDLRRTEPCRNCRWIDFHDRHRLQRALRVRVFADASGHHQSDSEGCNGLKVALLNSKRTASQSPD